jgi:hypothetical protein
MVTRQVLDHLNGPSPGRYHFDDLVDNIIGHPWGLAVVCDQQRATAICPASGHLIIALDPEPFN